jgi:hypothetical protein
MRRPARRLQPRKCPLIRRRVTAGSVSQLVSRTSCCTSEKLLSTGLPSGLPLDKLVPPILRACNCRRVRLQASALPRRERLLQQAVNLVEFCRCSRTNRREAAHGFASFSAPSFILPTLR